MNQLPTPSGLPGVRPLASAPVLIPRRAKGVWAVVRNAAQAMISDQTSIVAAGCAFYATLALFPAISILVFVYGLVFDPVTVEPQLGHLREVLPPPVFTLIDDRVRELVSRPAGSLTIGLVVSIMVTIWSSASGTKALLAGLNIAHGQPERRSFLHFQATAFGLTLCAIVAMALAIAILVFLPVAFSVLGLADHATGLIWASALTLLLGVIFLMLSVVYRYGPSQQPHRWRNVMPGALLATLLWMIGSTLFSLYVGRVASYDTTYGPLAAGVGVMMWLWVSVYVILLGAELNAELAPARGKTG